MGGTKKALTAEIDAGLLAAVNDLRASGAEIHLSAVMNLAVVLIQKHNLDHLLHKNGGKFVLGKAWASRWLNS